MAHGPIHGAAGNQTGHTLLTLIDDRVALVAVLLHQRGNLGNARRSRHSQHAVGHDGSDTQGGQHSLRQYIPHLGHDSRQPPAHDHRRRRPAVPPAAQRARHQPGIDLVHGAAGYQLHPIAQLYQYEQPIGCQRLAQAVGDRGDLIVEAGRGNGRGHSDRPLLDAQPLHLAQQQVIELLLRLGKGDVEKAPGDAQLRARLQQAGRGAHVANGSSVIGQPAGILINAQQQQGRLLRRQHYPVRAQPLHQQGGRRPHRLNLVGPARFGRLAQMVVDDVDGGMGR